MRISQADLAEYLGVARASLSQATSKGHKCKGYPVRAWAVYDGAGRVSGYDVPTHVMKEAPTEALEADKPAFLRQNPAFDLLREEDVSAQIPTTPALNLQDKPYIDASQRTSLLPEGEDYFRPAGAGGTAYVMSAAIESDNGTARGALLVAGTAIGSLTGWQVSNKNALGALIGAGIGYFAAITGLQSAKAGGGAPRPEPGGMGGQSQPRPPSHRVQGRGGSPSGTVRLDT